MIGLETWFVYAIISAVSGGIYIFTTKVAVERGYDGVIFNTFGSIISSVILFGVTAIVSDFKGLTLLAIGFALVNALAYMIGNFVRYDVLRCIDTAIFYPLYKTFSPILAIGVGILYFSEQFSTMEWIGLVMSLTVPLLLITHAEKARQKDLVRGLKLLFVACLLAAASASVLKLSADIVSNIWLFAACTHALTVGVGVSVLFSKKNSTEIIDQLRNTFDAKYLILILIMGVTFAGSFAFFMLALEAGTLSLVYTIQSLYILIPIVLSIIFYNEHWNSRKILAIILSIVALAFLQ